MIAFLVGGGLIASAFLVGQTVADGLLTEAGVAIFLFLPLYWIEERSYRVVQGFERRQEQAESAVAGLVEEVEHVKDEVRATNLRLDELGTATRDLIAADKTKDEAAIAAFEEQPTWETTQQMFSAGRRLRAIGDNVGCPIGMSSYWLFFGTVTRPARAQGFQPGLEVFLDFTNRQIDRRGPRSVFWSPTEDTQTFMKKIADGLKAANRYPGDSQFDASRILRCLLDTVKRAIGLRHAGRDIGAIYAIPNPEWAITESGLESLYEPFVIALDVIAAGVDIEPPPWVGIPATPERDVHYHDALELARKFFG